MSQAKEMREQRCKLVADARKIMDSAETLDAEQRSTVDAMLNDSDTLKADIDRVEAIAAEERQIKETAGKQSELAIAEPTIKEEARGVATAAYRSAFMQFLRGGKSSLSHAEYRDLIEGTNTAGGYIAPMFADGQANMQDMIIETMNDAQNFSPNATSFNIEGQVTIPTETSTGSAAWIAAEGDAYTESDPAFGQLTLTPHKAGTLTQISEELLQDAVVNLEAFVASNIGRKFALLLENAFVNGSGSGQPTGITDSATQPLVASSTTEVTFEELMTLFYSVKESYRQNGSWLMATASVKALRNLKYSGGTQAFIWEPSMALGSPDTILGRPVVISDSCEAMTAANKPILFGDLSYYYIAYNAGVSIQRLDELYAANGLIGIRGSLRVDGELTQSEAVQSIKMATS